MGAQSETPEAIPILLCALWDSLSGHLGGQRIGNDAMKNEEFYCDECHAKKNPTGNGWWICFLSQRDVTNPMRIVGVTRMNNYFTGLTVFPWNKELATERDAYHFCGEGCVHKHIAGFMANASRMPLSPSEVLNGGKL